MTDKPPPYSIEAEQSVLGSCLLDNRMIDDAALIIRAEDFFRADHAETWVAIVSLRDRGIPVDGVSLADYLIKAGRFAAMGGNEFLRTLVDAVPHAANGCYYAAIVREKAIGRALIEALEETMKECYAGYLPADELVAIAEERIFAIADREVDGTVSPMDAMVGEAVSVTLKRRDVRHCGLATGFPDLDDLVCGLQPGTLSLIAARPSIGKTSLAIAIAANVAAVPEDRSIKQKSVLFVSLEMNGIEITNRLMASWGDIDTHKLSDPRYMNEDEWRRFYDAAGEVERLGIHIDDSPVRSVSQIAAVARRMKHRKGLDLVMIDYLGLIDGRRAKNDNRQEEVAKISRDLKAMARHLDVPVIAMSQLNRLPESREGKRPRLSELRESGALEQDAHCVMLLHRPEFYDANDQPGIAEIIVAKNRNGPTGTVRLAFHKAFTRFDSLGPEIEEAAF